MGVVPAGKYDLLLVTLDKGAKKKKLPHLQYRDYAFSPRLFHWQSRASTTRDSSAGSGTWIRRWSRRSSSGRRARMTGGLGYRADSLALRVEWMTGGRDLFSITFELLDEEIPADLLVVARAAVA
jgi:hypothetical protein